jgi:hypothetical protein
MDIHVPLRWQGTSTTTSDCKSLLSNIHNILRNNTKIQKYTLLGTPQLVMSAELDFYVLHVGKPTQTRSGIWIIRKLESSRM